MVILQGRLRVSEFTSSVCLGEGLAETLFACFDTSEKFCIVSNQFVFDPGTLNGVAFVSQLFVNQALVQLGLRQHCPSIALINTGVRDCFTANNLEALNALYYRPLCGMFATSFLEWLVNDVRTWCLFCEMAGSLSGTSFRVDNFHRSIKRVDWHEWSARHSLSSS